ncbi:hypothetical protein ABT340_39655 [Streptosporangium sp. NPDC000239]|uniref:hypothetical protein n=1 Tax=Streptosporangium sp. NPDC000239 TaxID=3154248 RepID=UPI003321FA2A
MDISDILGQIKLPEEVVPLCLRADLQVEWERAEKALQAANLKASGSLAGTSKEVAAAAERVRAVEEQMQASTVDFRLRAVTTRRWSDLKAANPPREGHYEEWNPETFGVAVLAACSLEPKMSEEQAGQLVDAITEGQWEQLQTALGRINRTAVSVPKSSLASAKLRTSTKK